MNETILPLPEEQVGFAGKERLLAMIIDNVIAAVLGLLLSKVVPNNVSDVLHGVVAVTGYLGYFFLFEWLWGRTPGKAIFGLRVETMAGERCTLPGAAIRTLFRIIEVNPILLGALPGGLAVVFSSHKQRLGDRVAGVVVVRKPGSIAAGRVAA